MLTDPIADLLTRIRNASTANHGSVAIPVSKMKMGVVGVLQDEGYVSKYTVTEVAGKKHISVQLKYSKNKSPVITGLKRISKPGRRVYVNKQNLPKVLGGLGIAILSTSKGIMSEKAANTNGIGGEWICSVW